MSIEQLEIQISDNSDEAVGGIDKLIASLAKLSTATSNNAGVRKVATAIKSLSEASKNAKLDALSGQINSIVTSIAPLSSLGKNNLTSFITQLGKIPEVTKKLDVITTTAFGKAIEKVTIAVKPLAVEMDKISKGFGALPSRMQGFINQMGRSGKGATVAAKGYKNMASALNSLNIKANVLAVFYAIQKVVGLLSRAVDTANKYIENINLFTVAMGKYAESAREYAEKAQDLMGIDAGEFMRNQGFFMSIASGFGLAADKSALLSKNMTQLGYDLASFYNSDIDTAMQKLQSGLAGELEPLRRWGFALDQATLQQVAYNHGITMSIRDMNQAQKAQIRYLAIMEQSKNAQHDMARTLQSPANQMRVLSNQVTLLARSFGNLFIPILTKVIPYVIAFVKVLRMAAVAVASFLGAGITFEVDYDAFGGMSSGLSDGAAGASDIEDSLNGAADKAKKIKDYVMGFDELNIIQPPEVSAAGGKGAGSGGGFDNLDLPSYDFLDGLTEQADALVDKVKSIIPAILGIGAAVGVIALLPKIGKWIEGFSRLAKAMDLTPVGLLKSIGAVSIVIAVIVGALTLISERYKNLYENNTDFRNGIDSIKLVFKEIWTTVKSVGKGVAKLMLALIPKSVIEGAKNLVENLGGLKGIVLKILMYAGPFTAAFEGMFTAIKNLGKAADIGSISEFFEKVREPFEWLANTSYEDIRNATASLWGDIQTSVSGAFTSMKDTVSGWFTNHVAVWFTVEKWNGIMRNMINSFADGWNSVYSFFDTAVPLWWDETIMPWFTVAKWLSVFALVKQGVVSGWNSVLTIFTTSLPDWWNKTIMPWFTVAKWAGIWGNVSKAFSGMIDGIKTFAKSGFNVIIEAVNTIIRGINKIALDIPKIEGITDGFKLGFNIPEFPKLKVGMDFVPANEYPALLHYGEAVLPAKDATQYRALGGMNGILGALAMGADTSGKSAADLIIAPDPPDPDDNRPNPQPVDYARMAAAFSTALLENAGLFEKEGTVVNLDGRTLFESSSKQDQTYGYSAFRNPAINMG